MRFFRRKRDHIPQWKTPGEFQAILNVRGSSDDLASVIREWVRRNRPR